MKLFVALSIILFALASVAGCGSDRPTRVPVSGIVTIDGQPVPRGTIIVIPDDARPASSEIGPDGRFTLTTFETGDGCVTGKHKVTVMASEWLSPTQLKWHAPKNYKDLETSDLTVEITGPTQDLEVPLTWGAEKPFVETMEQE